MYELTLIGIWHGTLTIGATQLLLIFNFIQVNSFLKGYLDVPIQSVKKLPFDEIYLEKGYVIFNISSIGAHYKGNFKKNFDTIIGLYEQNGVKLDLVLNKLSNTSDYNVNRPQTPIRPFDYIEEEILVNNLNITLSGTLTYPKNTKPKVLVLLAHGSGGLDRDETIFEHKPFMVIADHLTKHNIAVFRYDERGIGKSTGNFMSAKDIDFADDLLASLRHLKNHEKLSCVSKIGIIGHSKGSATALIAKSLSKQVNFIIFLGGLGLNGELGLYLQTRSLLKANNQSDYYIDKIERANYCVYQIIKRENDVSKIREKIINFFDYLIENSNDIDKIIYTQTKDSTLTQLPSITVPWFRDILVFEPSNILSQTTIPILGLWGTNDLQVPPNENLNAMRNALEIANNKNYELKILNGLNHLFQNSTTGSPDEYDIIEETFSIEALNIITNWIERLML